MKARSHKEDVAIFRIRGKGETYRDMQRRKKHIDTQSRKGKISKGEFMRQAIDCYFVDE